MRLGRKAAIVGVGASRLGQRPTESVLQFAGEAWSAALADANLEQGAIDGLIVHVGSPRGPDYDSFAQAFGLTPRFCSQTWAHGRFAATVLQHAAMAVASEAATRVACVMAVKNSDLGRIGEAANPFFHELFREGGGPHGEEGHIGFSSPIAGAALAFDLYCRRYRQDRELLAEIPLTFRRHAQLTEDAQARTPLSLDDYRASRPIIDPLRLHDCSLVSDGAICVIVASEACSQAAPAPVWLTGGQGLRAGRDTFIFGPVGLGVGQQSERRLTAGEARAQVVYQMAGASPDTIDVLGVYDSFSPLPIYVLEDFGFCAAGEGLSWIQNGRLAVGGELPTNTNGGQLSHAQMNGWGQLRELVTQLRGGAGARQVPDARIAMWATTAGDAVILERN
jgi:acetyl-CoA acetyltransferase